MKNNPYKILIAPDKFKGSLSAMEVCEAIGKGLRAKNESLELTYHPMADGGEGSLEIISHHLPLIKKEKHTTDPLDREIIASYFTSKDTAFIELAAASGLVLLEEDERNPLYTSTFGTGLLMADAVSKGFKNIFLFLGGSATTDGGMGIAAAMGFQFLDENENLLKPIGKNLEKVERIKSENEYDFQKLNIVLLCDVTNGLVVCISLFCKGR